jgi:hypothetical protein
MMVAGTQPQQQQQQQQQRQQSPGRVVASSQEAGEEEAHYAKKSAPKSTTPTPTTVAAASPSGAAAAAAMRESTASSIHEYVTKRRAKTDGDTRKAQEAKQLPKMNRRHTLNDAAAAATVSTDDDGSNAQRSRQFGQPQQRRRTRVPSITKAEVVGDEAKTVNGMVSEWLAGRQVATVLSVPTQLAVVVASYDGRTSFTHKYVAERYSSKGRHVVEAVERQGSDLYGVRNCTVLRTSAPAGSLEVHVAIRLPIDQAAAAASATVPAEDVVIDESKDCPPPAGTTLVHTKTLFSKELTGGWPSGRRVAKKMVEWLKEIGVNCGPLEVERCEHFEKTLTANVSHSLPEASLEHWVKVLDVPFSDVVRFEYDGPLPWKKNKQQLSVIKGEGEERDDDDDESDQGSDEGSGDDRGGNDSSPIPTVRRRASLLLTSPKLEHNRSVANAVFQWRAKAKKEVEDPNPKPPPCPPLATSKATLTDLVKSNDNDDDDDNNNDEDIDGDDDNQHREGKASNNDGGTQLEGVVSRVAASPDTAFPRQEWSDAWEADGELAEQQLPSRPVHVCRVPRTTRLVLVGYRDHDDGTYTANVSGNVDLDGKSSSNASDSSNSKGSTSTLTLAAAAPPCIAFELTTRKAESTEHGNIHWYCHRPPGHPRAYFGQDFGFSTQHHLLVPSIDLTHLLELNFLRAHSPPILFLSNSILLPILSRAML